MKRNDRNHVKYCYVISWVEDMYILYVQDLFQVDHHISQTWTK
jgi:hypothetical protein